MTDSLTASVAEKLVTWRLAAGFSQRQLASRAEMTNGALSQIESGKVSPSLSTLAKLCGALEIDMQALLKSPVYAPLKVVSEDTLTVESHAGCQVARYGAVAASERMMWRILMPGFASLNLPDINAALPSELNIQSCYRLYIAVGKLNVTVLGEQAMLISGDSAELHPCSSVVFANPVVDAAEFLLIP